MSALIIGGAVVAAAIAYGAWAAWSTNSVKVAIDQRKESYNAVKALVEHSSGPNKRAAAEHLETARSYLDEAVGLAAKASNRAEIRRQLNQVDKSLHLARVLVAPDQDDDDDNNWLTKN